MATRTDILQQSRAGPETCEASMASEPLDSLCFRTWRWVGLTPSWGRKGSALGSCSQWVHRLSLSFSKIRINSSKHILGYGIIASDSIYRMRPEKKKETKTINQNFISRKQISFSVMLLLEDLTKYPTCITVRALDESLPRFILFTWWTSMSHCKILVTLGARAGVPWVGSGHRTSKFGAAARNTKTKQKENSSWWLCWKLGPRIRTTVRAGWQRGAGISVPGQAGAAESKPGSEWSWQDGLWRAEGPRRRWSFQKGTAYGHCP